MHSRCGAHPTNRSITSSTASFKSAGQHFYLLLCAGSLQHKLYILQTQEQTQGDDSGGNDKALEAVLMFTALITTEPFVFKGNSPDYCSNNIIQKTADGSVNIPVIMNYSNTKAKMSKLCFSLNKYWKLRWHIINSQTHNK